MRLLVLFLSPFYLFAHSLSVTASYEGKELFVESYFGDGTPCKECKFTVEHKGEVVFNAALAEDGSFEQDVELKAPFTVIVDGGMGHRADVSIEGNEFEAEEPLKEQSDQQSTKAPQALAAVDEVMIKKIVRAELKKQTVQLETLIEKNRSKTDKILMGLGYILGIFGIWQLLIRKKG